MLYHKAIIRISDSERCKREDLINDCMKKGSICSEAQKLLQKYQNKYKKIDLFIYDCKSHIFTKPINPNDVPIWELPSNFGPEKDFYKWELAE